MGRSFQQPGTVKENVLESDFEPLCDGTTRRRSLADLRLAIYIHFENNCFGIFFMIIYYETKLL